MWLPPTYESCERVVSGGWCCERSLCGRGHYLALHRIPSPAIVRNRPFSFFLMRAQRADPVIPSPFLFALDLFNLGGCICDCCLTSGDAYGDCSDVDSKARTDADCDWSEKPVLIFCIGVQREQARGMVATGPARSADSNQTQIRKTFVLESALRVRVAGWPWVMTMHMAMASCRPPSGGDARGSLLTAIATARVRATMLSISWLAASRESPKCIRTHPIGRVRMLSIANVEEISSEFEPDYEHQSKLVEEVKVVAQGDEDAARTQQV